MSVPPRPILYSYWRSSCSWRVRLALNLKKIDFDYRAVHLVRDGGEQNKEEYKQTNPESLVPTLVIPEHDGDPAIILTQSIAILEYLEEVMTSAIKLLPENPVERAKVRAIVQHIASDTQPLQNLRVLKHELLSPNENKTTWARHWITTSFQSLEKILHTTAGHYSVGDVITLADVCLVPQVYNARRFGVDLDQFPIIARIDQELSSLSAFSASHPSNQPDAEPL